MLVALWCIYAVAAEQPGVYDVIIVNDNLDTAYDELKKFLDKVGNFQTNRSIMDKFRLSDCQQDSSVFT
jgi:hypothetical protein